ncbi:stage III sporulation protein AF [Bacillus licheniformis]|nr:stage III sporulation protein AF [Bacillus licheniformis]
MVISLLLIVVILNPIFSLFRTDPDVILRSLQKRTSSVKRNKNQLNSEKRNTSLTTSIYLRTDGCSIGKERRGQVYKRQIQDRPSRGLF